MILLTLALAAFPAVPVTPEEVCQAFAECVGGTEGVYAGKDPAGRDVCEVYRNESVVGAFASSDLKDRLKGCREMKKGRK